jgi:CHASE3 domain sensor protein
MYDLKLISELLRSYVLTNDNSIKKEIQSKSEKLIKRFDSTEGLNKTEPVNNEKIGWISILILLIISNIVLFIIYKRKV